MSLHSIYIDYLPIVVPATTILGFITGLASNSYTYNPLEMFTNIIAYTTIGFITGLLYPVSYPLIGANLIIQKTK